MQNSNNLVKLVQSSGKGLIVPASAVSGGVVRTMEDEEKKLNPNGNTFLFVVLNGQAHSAVVRERMGFVLAKSGSGSADRVTLRGMGDTKVSMPRSIFAHALEIDRTKVVDGEEVSEAATVIHTSLMSATGGNVSFLVKERADDLFDLFTEESSEDNPDEPEPEVRPSIPERNNDDE